MPLLPQIPLPSEVLTAGLEVFTTTEVLREWIQKPADWANKRTPAELIANGQDADVLSALKGLAYGNHL